MSNPDIDQAVYVFTPIFGALAVAVGALIMGVDPKIHDLKKARGLMIVGIASSAIVPIYINIVSELSLLALAGIDAVCGSSLAIIMYFFLNWINWKIARRTIQPSAERR